MLSLLSGSWQPSFIHVVSCARDSLVISSPYITEEGVNLVLSNLHPSFLEDGRLTVVTNLAPLNMIQGSTDPEAVLAFTRGLNRTKIYHLPKLHAKVYICDQREAIVTSGNLTNGGLRLNLEYGVRISDPETVADIQTDILEYADLGAVVQPEKLLDYCQATKEAKAAFHEQQRTAAKSAQRRFADALETANEELIRLRLSGETTNSVFAKTIMYLLRKHGSLTTQELHVFIQQLHPDLCDDTVDRVINGQRYGKKWKHAVRSAQQSLKQARGIVLDSGSWRIWSPNGSP